MRFRTLIAPDGRVSISFGFVAWFPCVRCGVEGQVEGHTCHDVEAADFFVLPEGWRMYVEHGGAYAVCPSCAVLILDKSVVDFVTEGENYRVS
jgi:hypothetical protein